MLRIPLDNPLCAIDCAERLGVEVWLSDVSSLEGFYVKGKPPRVFLPADRPMGRLEYACGHELGHHHFGHGTRLDQYLSEETEIDDEEYLADVYAASFLMPEAAVRLAFSLRGWNPSTCDAVQAYSVSCALGVSYEALVAHMAGTLRLIRYTTAQRLLTATPKRIAERFFDRPVQGRVIPVDVHWFGTAIDTEIGDTLVLPSTSIIVEGDSIRIEDQTATAIRRGISQVATGDGSWSVFVRVKPRRFVGIASVRHLGDPDEH
jgi:Zn-dependent peptidase ImmA (M78 family)